MPRVDVLYAVMTTVLAQDGSAAQAAAEGERTILEYIQSGGLLSYILIVLSIMALTLMIVNIVHLRRSHLMPETIVDGLEKLLASRNIDGVLGFARQEENDSFLTRVIAGGLASTQRSQFGLLNLNTALEDAAARELENLDRPTHGLALLAAIGPMLGLLGTVIGMIGAFGAISKFEGAARSSQLSDFMSLALVNTAEGLILAIPCTIAYSIFRRRTDHLMREVADTAEWLTAPLQSGPAQRQPAPRPIPIPRPSMQAPVPNPVAARPTHTGPAASTNGNAAGTHTDSSQHTGQ